MGWTERGVPFSGHVKVHTCIHIHVYIYIHRIYIYIIIFIYVFVGIPQTLNPKAVRLVCVSQGCTSLIQQAVVLGLACSGHPKIIKTFASITTIIIIINMVLTIVVVIIAAILTICHVDLCGCASAEWQECFLGSGGGCIC